MSRLSITTILALSVLLAACQSTHDGATSKDEAARSVPQTDAATLGEEPATRPLPDVQDALCNAAPVQGLIGQRVSDDLVAQALKDSGSSISRVLKPNEPATLDLSPSRLNILTDGDGVVQSLHCG